MKEIIDNINHLAMAYGVAAWTGARHTEAREALYKAVTEMVEQQAKTVHKYKLELPDGDTREIKVWWSEQKLIDDQLTHKLCISVDETPSTIYPDESYGNHLEENFTHGLLSKTLTDEQIDAIHPMDKHFPIWKRAFAKAVIEEYNAKLQTPNVTQEMIDAAENVEDLYRRGTPDTWRKVYVAMYKAAPRN